MPLDSASWAALALVLTAVGAACTYLAWRRHGPAAAARGLAWTLLPLAAWLTGTLRLAGRIVDAVTSWAAGLVFDPLTWLGIALAGVSVVLFGATAAMKRRSAVTAGASDRQPKRRSVRGPSAAQLSAARNRKGTPMVDDLGDIEAILKKHGIS